MIMADNKVPRLKSSSELDLLKIPFDDVLRLTQPFNSYQTGLSTTLYGINHQGSETIKQSEYNHQGYVFFTRPQLNLLDYNCTQSRPFISLLTKEQNSIFRYVRGMLDPRLGTMIPSLQYGGDFVGVGPEAICPYLDNKNIFIAPCTNYITSLSGWPEPVVESFTSAEGIRREQWSMVDGTMQLNGVFDMTATFQNVKENPILLIFYYWSLYTTLVFDGTMSPYLDMIAANEIDYNTRIWRLVMSSDKTRVKWIGCTGASYPLNPDIGKIFNYNKSTPLSDENKEINISFRCMSAHYQDPILIDEFNKCVGIGNPDMELIRQHKLFGDDVGKKTDYVKVTRNILNKLNFRGYPMIDYETNELEWYISKNSPSYRYIQVLMQQGLV